MSECIGPGCTHPDHGHGLTTTQAHRSTRVQGITATQAYVDEWTGPANHDQARRDLGNALGWNPDKFAAMPRRERRAAARGRKRHNR